MPVTATNDPFGAIKLHHRTIGSGKNRRVEAWWTTNQNWKYPWVADIKGIGKTLDEACHDGVRQMMGHLEKERHFVATTDTVFRIDLSAVTITSEARIMI